MVLNKDCEIKENIVEQCKSEILILVEDKSRRIVKDTLRLSNTIIESGIYPALLALFNLGMRFKVIHIDFPFNIGKFDKDSKRSDLFFNDLFVDSKDPYRTSKFRCSSRNILFLVKKLLTEDGVAIMHIGNEYHYDLGDLCNEIFGRENWVTEFTWANNEGGGSSDSNLFPNKQRPILCYATSKRSAEVNKEKLTEEDIAQYTEVDDYVNERGPYQLVELDPSGIGKGYKYPITLIDGTIVYPRNKGWRFIESTYIDRDKKHMILPKKIKNECRIYVKQYLYANDEGETYVDGMKYVRTKSLDSIINGHSTTQATKQLKKMFGEKVFDYPIPVELIEPLLSIFTEKDSDILSIYANDGVVGHATLKLNNSDGGNRRFVLCTHNRMDVCTDVCYPRIQKAINGYTDINGDVVTGLGGNLRYYNISLESMEKTDTNKWKLYEKIPDTLCFKEDFYEFKKDTNYTIFINSLGKYMAISYSPYGEVESLCTEIKNINKNMIVYVFGFDNEKFDENFASVADLVTPISQPTPVLNPKSL